MLFFIRGKRGIFLHCFVNIFRRANSGPDSLHLLGWLTIRQSSCANAGKLDEVGEVWLGHDMIPLATRADRMLLRRVTTAVA